MQHGLGAHHDGGLSLLDRGPFVTVIGFQESTLEVAPFPNRVPGSQLLNAEAPRSGWRGGRGDSPCGVT